ncbi:hypothetical protein [Pseudomonas syringae group sp. J309-1]|uniref:hypothetical protein n=1 Tax=Pseudomonas syringae group sp. J309-1 TaxID=3079588 RepID=UPI002907B400|nr:hypothetical protein [Pseudomonas syringae group sp. J309-1]MDU8357993.1 hypothetical protein [Pseudomonas syringae group sp. J309-1]
MSEHSTDQISTSGPFADPKDFLLAVMNDRRSPTDIRIEAAQALMPYYHAELGQEKDD